MNKWIEIGAYSALSAAIAATATYFVTKKRMEKILYETVESQVLDIKNHYRELIEKTKNQMRQEAAKDALEAVVANLGYDSAQEVQEEIAELDKHDEDAHLVRNIWDTPQLTPEEYENGVGIDPEPDEPEDVEEGYIIPRGARVREPDHPFTITRVEYEETEEDYDKITLTYYEGDDQLTDDSDEIIDDIEGTIGPDALDSFGHISGDPSICFVRNRMREVDFEIIKRPGAHSVEVLGADPEDVGIKRIKERVMKMRDDE